MKFQIAKAGSSTQVTLRGSVMEGDVKTFADLYKVLPSGALVFDCEGLVFFNSLGVTAWMRFFQAIPTSTPLTFRNCPDQFVGHCEMFNNFLGHGIVESLIVAPHCDDCNHTERHLVKAPADFPKLRCPKCGGAPIIGYATGDALALLKKGR